eukprot:749273-Hanusia_phi.AAC.4
MGVHQAVDPPTSAVMSDKLAVELKGEKGAAIIAQTFCLVSACSEVNHQEQGVKAGKKSPPKFCPTQPITNVECGSNVP